MGTEEQRWSIPTIPINTDAPPIDRSSSTLRLLSRHLTEHRRRLGTRWRLPPGRQALLVLAHLRCGDSFHQLAPAFGVGAATTHRYIREAVSVLAALSPTLEKAVAPPTRRS